MPRETDELPFSGELPDPQQSLTRYLRLGFIMIGALLLSLLIAATLIQITGAVVGSGEVAVASKVKTIAHPDGGVIAHIWVRDGDRVKAGDPLIRFDTTVTAAGASLSETSLDQLLAQGARLRAERDGLLAIAFPPALANRSDASAQRAMAGEQRLFDLRRKALTGEQALLAERIQQFQQQIASYEAQIAANEKQTKLIAPELKGVRDLWKRKLVTINRLNELERTAVSLEGNIAALQANIAQTRASIAEIRQQSIQLVQQYRSEAGAQLAAAEQKIADQRLQNVSATESYRRSVLRAPAAGVIDSLAYTTIGGVVPPGQTILQIVPDRGILTVDARISPADVDQLHAGQDAKVNFSAFNRQTTPEIHGVLGLVSAKPIEDPRTGRSYYQARIDLPQTELEKLGNLNLVPGMPAEVYIRAGRRSLLSYIMKPIRDQFTRAFRES